MNIITEQGITLTIQRNEDGTYILAENPNNPPQFQEITIGEVVHSEDFGLGFNQFQHLALTLGPDVLRGIADLIEKEQ